MIRAEIAVKDLLKKPLKIAPLFLNRRRFLTFLAAGLALSQMSGWLSSCGSLKDDGGSKYLNDDEKLLIMRVQEFLFPGDGNGPGAHQINAHGYLEWVLADENYDADERAYVLKGIRWTQETANELKGSDFKNLNSHAVDELLKHIANEDWGAHWYSLLMNFILEALLSDPIYGSNIDKLGWSWLSHNPGLPRPTERQKYGVFLKS